jgi:carboxylesterase
MTIPPDTNPFGRLFQAPEHQPFVLAGEPDAPAALLIHGFPGTPAEMRPLAYSLHGRGWHVEGLLLPGLGPQIERLFAVGWQEWRAAVHQATRRLRERGRPTLLLGFSLGAALALDAAVAERPDGVALLAPFQRLHSPLWAALPVLRHIFPRVYPFRLFKPDFSNPEMRAGAEQFMPGMDLDDPQVRQGMRDFAVPIGLFDEIRRAGVAAWRAAPRLDAQAVVIQGAQDALVTPKASQILAERLGRSARQRAVLYHEVTAAHDLPDPSKPAFGEVERLVGVFAEQVRAG